jgi:hypothetical protein
MGWQAIIMPWNQRTPKMKPRFSRLSGQMENLPGA